MDAVVDAQSAVKWRSLTFPTTCLLALGRNSRVRSKVPRWRVIEAEVRKFCMRPDKQEVIRERGMTEHEAHAIALYTFGFTDQAEGNVYFEENSDLRLLARAGPFEREDVIEAWRHHIIWMLSGMDRLPGFTGHCFRVVKALSRADVESTYAVGRLVSFAAFTSTTTAANVAIEFALDDPDAVVFRIHCFDGKVLSCLSFYPNEQEVLLQPGLTFVVSSGPTEENVDGKWVTFVGLVQVRGEVTRT